MKKIINLISINLIFIFFIIKAYAAVSNAVPTTALSKIAKSTSFSSSNNSNVSSQNTNTTSSTIDTAKLKKEISTDAKKFGLAIDEDAMANLNTSFRDADADEISDALSKLEENIKEGKDWDYIPEKTPDTYIYQFGTESNWKELTQKTSYDGKSYSNTGNAFDTSATQYARSDVYVDFKKKEIWADIWTKLTPKGKSQISSERTTGVATLSSIPVVAIDTHAVLSNGNVTGPDFDDNPDTIQDSATQLHNNPWNGDSGTMNHYNHNTSDPDAEGGFFFYGKFTTNYAGGDGTATIGIEAANCDQCSESDYIGTIERYEVSGSIEGRKALQQ